MSTAKCSPLLEIYFLGVFFHIHTVQNILVLSAAGPEFPAGPVLDSMGCSCFADGVDYFFPAPSEALVVDATHCTINLAHKSMRNTSLEPNSHTSSSLMLRDVANNNFEFTLASGSVIS